MKNLDCEIYLNNFIQFFRNNPDDLTNLIGKADTDDFFEEVKKQVYKNLQKGEELELTQKQLVNIVVKLNKVDGRNVEKIVETFIETPYGLIGLN